MLDPVELGFSRSTIGQWRRVLFERSPRCVVCGSGANHLHEGVLTRGEVQGFSFPDRLRVFAECNCFPICQFCHKSPPPREWFFERSCNQFGEAVVRNWYASFGWKSPPRKEFMPNGT